MTIAGKYHPTLKLFLTLAVLLRAVGGYGAPAPPDKEIDITITPDHLSMTFRQAPLGDVVKEIERYCGIVIAGLEERSKNVISFQIKDATLENAFKALLKHLGETSYAFQYQGNTLIRIAVVKESTKTYPVELETAPVGKEAPSEIALDLEDPRESMVPSPEMTPSPHHVAPNLHLADPDKPSEDAGDTIKAVRVINVVAESQGARAGVMRGDIILEYDGVAVDQPETLIKAVKQSIRQDRIVMTVERNDELIDIELQGGFIGVSVIPVTLPR